MSKSNASPSRLRRALRSLLRLLPVWIVGIVITLSIVEIAYRFTLFDPYRAELESYNSDAQLERAEAGESVLCMGDSLTAGPKSWPARLRRDRPGLNVVNAGIPGSGILQTSWIAPRRIDRFRPSTLIYQINVTNDLLNVRYPVNWGELSL